MTTDTNTTCECCYTLNAKPRRKTVYELDGTEHPLYGPPPILCDNCNTELTHWAL